MIPIDKFQEKHFEILDKFRSKNEEWILQHQHLITHSLTLTFDCRHLLRTLNKYQSSQTLNHPDVVEWLQASMRYFKNRLNKSLYGNRRGRILLIPVIEGLGIDQKPHYHCHLGVSKDRFDAVEAKVKSIWKEVPFGGTQVVVKPYRDHGWVGYSTKNTLFANRESIDWMNILLPTCSSSTAE